MPIIEKVLGITPGDDPWAMLAQAHTTLSGEPTSRLDVQLEYSRLADLNPKMANRDDMERATALCGVREIIDHRYPVGNRVVSHYLTPLSIWATYDHLMSRWGDRAQGSARALLIGAASALSARAFQVLAQDIYGADQAYVVDVQAGKDKRTHGLFAYANGLELPFRDGAMDFVQTSSLIHQLVDVRSPSRRPRELITALFSEIWRVLAPNGQLVMNENLVGMPDDVEDVSDEQIHRKRERGARAVGAAMAQAGFADIHIEREILPASTDYLFRPDGDWRRDRCLYTLLTMNIYGRKPKRTAYEAPAMPGWRRVIALGSTAAYTSPETKADR
jgi:SAM-dependent methyltransferase